MTAGVTIELSVTTRQSLAEEAARSGVTIEALAEEAILRHVEARRTLAHFEALRAEVDWEWFDRVLARAGGEPSPECDRLPERG